MNVKVHITTIVGEARNEVSYESGTASEYEKIAILAGLFNVLGVELPQLIETFEHTGKAYQEFFKEMKHEHNVYGSFTPKVISDHSENSFTSEEKPVEHVTLPVTDEEPSALQQAYAQALEKKRITHPMGNTSGKDIYATAEEQPEWYKTGIKVRDGINHYRCRVLCKCGTRSIQYIPEDSKTVNCYHCKKSLNVHYAVKGQYMTQDRNDNYFIAKE